MRANVRHRVGVVDVPRTRASGQPVSLPHGAHEVVERGAAVGVLANREVEPQAERRAVGVIRDERIAPVGAVDPAGGVYERREPAHVLDAPEPRRGARHHGFRQAACRAGELGERRDARARQDQAVVVGRDPFGEPEFETAASNVSAVNFTSVIDKQYRAVHHDAKG